MYPSYQQMPQPQPPQYQSASPAHGQPPSSAQRQSDSGLESLLGLLKFMEKDELHKLLDSDEKVMDLVKGCQELQQLYQEKVTVMTTNRSLAEHNLSMRPRIDEGKQQLKRLSEEAGGLRDTLAANRARLQSLNGSASTDTLLTLLEAASMEAEEKSEELLAALNAGSLSVGEFVRDYAEARQTYHLRKIKAEKLTGLANRQFAQPRAQQPQPPMPPPAWQPQPPQQQQQLPSYGFAPGYGY